MAGRSLSRLFRDALHRHAAVKFKIPRLPNHPLPAAGDFFQQVILLEKIAARCQPEVFLHCACSAGVPHINSPSEKTFRAERKWMALSQRRVANVALFLHMVGTAHTDAAAFSQ